jgi:hypothetical protein
LVSEKYLAAETRTTKGFQGFYEKIIQQVFAKTKTAFIFALP